VSNQARCAQVLADIPNCLLMYRDWRRVLKIGIIDDGFCSISCSENVCITMSFEMLCFKTEERIKNITQFLGEREIPFLSSFDEVADWVSGRDFKTFELISLEESMSLWIYIIMKDKSESTKIWNWFPPKFKFLKKVLTVVALSNSKAWRIIVFFCSGERY